MSRIGRLPIALPAGVTVSADPQNAVTVKGPKGELSEQIHRDIMVEILPGVVNVKRASEDKEHKALHGLSRALINNMVIGVTAGYQKTLIIEGTGYRAAKAGNKLTLQMGYSHPVEFVEEKNITFTVPAPNSVVVSGISKQRVGELAANIRGVRPPEPYLGKGIKYENEHIRRKAGKAGKK